MLIPSHPSHSGFGNLVMILSITSSSTLCNSSVLRPLISPSSAEGDSSLQLWQIVLIWVCGALVLGVMTVLFCVFLCCCCKASKKWGRKEYRTGPSECVSVSVCACMCMCMCVCVCTCVCVCACMHVCVHSAVLHTIIIAYVKFYVD